MPNKAKLKETIHLIDNWLDYQTYIKEIPGVAVGVFAEDEIIFKKEYGYANLKNKTKLTDKHLFRIASHSKLFTATAIMKLYHQEKLSIDDKVSKHLPWFTSDKDENMQQVRIRHLLTHSSGMSRDGTTAHWYNHKFPGLEEIKAQVKEGISFFPTSEILKYSNFGYTLLGQIIEAVSGVSYFEYIQKEILDPLEMTNTIVDVDDTNIANHATGHKRRLPREDRQIFEHVPAKIMHSATGLSSTVEDLIKFFKAHMLGNNILFPDYIKREMQRIQFKAKDADWGLGFSITVTPDDTIVGHGGGYPGFITRSGSIQEKKIIIIVLTNAIDGPALTLFNGIKNILNQPDKKKKELEAKAGVPVPDFQDITGFFAGDWGVSLFTQIGHKFIGIAPAADNSVEVFQIYEHIEGHKFKLSKEYPFGSPGQYVEFIDGPDGDKIFIDSHKGQSKRFKYSY